MLPIFLYGDPGIASSIAPEMETAIQKATKVITLHSITVKPEFKDGPQSEKQQSFYERNEYNRFVPWNYLLMGKAYLHRHDFNLAIETFKYILTEYHYDEIVFEIHNTEDFLIPYLKEIMENVYPHEHLKLTVGVETSKTNWKDKDEDSTT